MFPPGRASRIAVLLAATALLPAQTTSNPSAVARKALDLLLAQRYPELSEMFSETLKKSVTLDFLQDRVNAELKEFGKPQTIGEPVLGADGTNSLISFPVQFSNTNIHVQFTLNQTGQVSGMYFRPPNKALPLTWKRPAYSKPESFREREVSIGNDMWKLTG